MDIQKITDDVEVQGTEYKEQSASIVEDDVEDSEAPKQSGRAQRSGSSGRTRSERRAESSGNQKTMIIAAGAVLAVIIIIIVAAVYFKSQKGKGSDAVIDEYGDLSEFEISEDSPLYQAAMDAQNNSNNNDNSQQENESQNSISYSDDEIKQLREAGYTGQEIEKFASQELRVTTKIAEAKAEQRQFFEENLKDYLDGKSEKYKELETYTWLGQEELIFDAGNKDNWNNKEVVKNCDYVKVPARGYQTFLRVEIQDGKYAFMLVRPERYQELPQTGNIVVYIRYYTTGDTTIIYQIEEKAIN